MQLSDFQYELPPELIAQTPPSRRGASRLLELNPDGNTLVDRQFSEIAHLVAPGDLLILNDTRVVPARLLGQKDTGGRVEVLVERVLDTHNCIAHVRANRSPAAGTSFTLAGRARVLVHDRSASLYELKITDDVSWAVLMQDHGEVPLPPYIKRGPDDADRQRYQTVYARHDGAVAAPTAGLHWNEELLRDLEARGVQIEYITLHVGAGTFAPVKVDDISSHPMHAERAVVSERVCDAVTRVRANGGRVVAVGTTCVRALESAALRRAGSGVGFGAASLAPVDADTDIFIYPGFEFRVVDALVTNFHLPGSTLLMLICAFAGYEPTLRAYRHAISQGYRFFSYGDAMFLQRRDLGNCR